MRKGPRRTLGKNLAAFTSQIDRSDRSKQTDSVSDLVWPQLLSESLTFILKIIPATLLELLLCLIRNNTGTGCVVSD